MISIVVPTLNERDNVANLIGRLLSACGRAGMEIEIIVVDDLSPDGTAEAARAALPAGKGLVLSRNGPKGLAPAAVFGLTAAHGDIVGVMDSDLSHPPESVPNLVRAIESGADIAVGSRYVAGGGVEGWPFKRRAASKLACMLARPLTPVRDSTSGFIFMKRGVLDGMNLRTGGFKIGLEIMVQGRRWKTVEVPYVFRNRAAGHSKLGGKVIAQYAAQLVRLAAQRLLGAFLPARRGGFNPSRPS